MRLQCSNRAALFICSSVFEYTQFVWLILNVELAIHFIRRLEIETLFALNERSISIFLNCLSAATVFFVYVCVALVGTAVLKLLKID